MARRVRPGSTESFPPSNEGSFAERDQERGVAKEDSRGDPSRYALRSGVLLPCGAFGGSRALLDLASSDNHFRLVPQAARQREGDSTTSSRIGPGLRETGAYGPRWRTWP